MGPRDTLDGCGITCPTEIRSPDRPVRNESLYRLSYPSRRVHTSKMPFNIRFLFFKKITSPEWYSCLAVYSCKSSGGQLTTTAAGVCQCLIPTLTCSLVPDRDDIIKLN